MYLSQFSNGFIAGLMLLSTPIAVAFQPSLQSLQWTHNRTHYWSPLSFNATVYAYASPTGNSSASLNKRGPGRAGQTYTPCTVITVNASATELSSSLLETTFSEYVHLDDVWHQDVFLECLFVQYAGNRTALSVQPGLLQTLAKKNVKSVYISNQISVESLSIPEGVSIKSVHSACEFSNGPYVAAVSEGSIGLAPVYSLNPDNYEAFMEGSFESDVKGKFTSMHLSIPGTRLPAIITPSRLSSLNSYSAPLAGLRFAVKDIFNIEGMKTSGGSRAYYQTYATQNYTTETVQLTLQGGAAMIGKTRTIAFALGTPRNGEQVDYLNPWSSRGDGYQDTGGSSSGSGAAVTAYDWVDFAIGSDTGGSVRFPARYGGIYGYKPTHGIFNLTGILVAIAEQDTPGFLARSPSIFTRVGRHWLAGKSVAPFSKLPTNLLYYADESPRTQPVADELIQTFFTNVSTLLNMTTSSVNLSSTFLAQNISGTFPPQNVSTFMRYVYSDQNSVQGWNKIGSPLAAAYAAQNNGAFPPADKPVNISWADGQNSSTRARYPESQRRRETFASFFNKFILPYSNETCSESIFAHSYHTAPNTGKTTPSEASLTIGWYNGVAFNYAGAPEIVVPVGQIEYWSSYTRKLEWQPVTVALGAAKGCDLTLFTLVDVLVGAGLLKETLPGKVPYPVQ